MKTTKILAAVVAMAAAAPAFAGSMDKPVIEDHLAAPMMDVMDVMTETSTDWSGAYVGIGLGSQSLGGDVDGDGMTLSLHGGYNMDLGDFVVGAEVDYSALSTDLDGGGEMKNAMSAKLRGGYDMGDFLPYVSLGMQRATFDVGGTEHTGNGAVYGIGVDYKLGDNMILGGELTRASFDDFDGAGNDADKTTFGVKLSMAF